MTQGAGRRVAVAVAQGLGALLALAVLAMLGEGFGDTSDGVDRFLIGGLMVMLVGTVVLILAPSARTGPWRAVNWVAATLLAAPVVLFLAFFVIGGLVAPDLVADPDSARAPSSPTEARAFSAVMVFLWGGAAVIVWVQRRRRQG